MVKRFKKPFGRPDRFPALTGTKHFRHLERSHLHCIVIISYCLEGYLMTTMQSQACLVVLPGYLQRYYFITS